MNFLFRLFLTFNATSLIIVVYLVKERYLLEKFLQSFSKLPDFVSYTLYFMIPLILTYLSLILSKFLDNDSIHSDNYPAIKEVEREPGSICESGIPTRWRYNKRLGNSGGSPLFPSLTVQTMSQRLGTM